MCFKKIFRCLHDDDSYVYIYNVLEKITDIYCDKQIYNQKMKEQHKENASEHYKDLQVTESELSSLNYDDIKLKRALHVLRQSGFIQSKNLDNTFPYTVADNNSISRLADFQLDRRRHNEVMWLQRFSVFLAVIIVILTIYTLVK